MLSGDNRTSICTSSQFSCYVMANKRFSSNFIVENCVCLPDCNSIYYEIDLSQTPSNDPGDEFDDGTE